MTVQTQRTSKGLISMLSGDWPGWAAMINLTGRYPYLGQALGQRKLGHTSSIIEVVIWCHWIWYCNVQQIHGTLLIAWLSTFMWQNKVQCMGLVSSFFPTCIHIKLLISKTSPSLPCKVLLESSRALSRVFNSLARPRTSRSWGWVSRGSVSFCTFGLPLLGLLFVLFFLCLRTPHSLLHNWCWFARKHVTHFYQLCVYLPTSR